MTVSESLGTAKPARLARLLLVDDDPEICEALQSTFENLGFHTETCSCGRSALQRALHGQFDGLILDVTLPILDGYEVARQVRRRSDVPIMLLTGRAAHEDRIAGFRAGADDYVTKPFHLDELVLRVTALLRRTRRPRDSSPEPVRIGDLELDPATRTALHGGTDLGLTVMEFEILDLLSRSPGQVVTREAIWSVLHQRELSPLERALDTHISNLRRKLSSVDTVSIRTVRNSGYILTKLTNMEHPSPSGINAKKS
jgi:DNA-binding response OmpR family regulator